jgi:hypothetical protein
MKISNIKMKSIVPTKWHIWFVSCVIDDWLFLNNIAIFSRLSNPSRIRLVFPEKKVWDKKINIFYPLKSQAYFELEKVISEKIKELWL